MGVVYKKTRRGGSIHPDTTIPKIIRKRIVRNTLESPSTREVIFYMKKRTKQFKFIKDPELNESELNLALLELSEKKTEVTFSDGYARIEYTKDFEEIEPPVTEKGITFTCGECPMFKPVLNRKGEPDGRVKYGDCEFSEFGRTWKTTAACQNLYTLIKNGSVTLTLNETMDKLTEPILIPSSELDRGRCK